MPRAPSRERTFGCAVGAVLTLVAVWLWLHGRRQLAGWSGALGVALLVLGWLWPRALAVPNALWLRLARLLGWINTRIILSAMFFLVLTPLGAVLRLAGWDTLRRRAAGTTGWRSMVPATWPHAL